MPLTAGQRAGAAVGPGDIGTTELADGAVTTAKIADGDVETAKIADGAVTYAKIQDVSATDKVLGRSTAGAGDVEEIACTAAGRALLADADAATQRTTLGLGSMAEQASSSVTITGGSITGITDLAVADGGTGGSTAATARSNLGVANFLLPVAIDTPTAKTYRVLYRSSFSFLVSSVWAGTDQGTCDVNVINNGTSITSMSAISVSSTYAQTSSSGNATVATTGYLEVAVSNVAGDPNELILTFQCSRN